MLSELLLEGAATAPERPLVVSGRGTVTYRDGVERAGAFADGLRALGIDRFACVVTDIADLIALLAASSATGAEACQYPASSSPEDAARLAEHFGHHVTVTDTDRDYAGRLSPDELAAAGAANPRAGLARDGEGSPLMILTTGTTGLPKGARQEWARLVATHRGRKGPADARWLLAHVPNQFAGLGVLLHCLASGATLVVPDAFQPREALAAMLEHGVTRVSTTPTFWRFLLGLVDDDSARRLQLEQITLAGEAVPSRLLDDLRARFPDANISQIYGATEFGSSVAVSDGRNGLPVSVLERPDTAEVQFKIVDGELFVRSNIGMLGYFGTDDVGDSWRPTGDMVEVRGDRVHFVGRASETINVGGSKVHPLPIEEIVSQVDGVELAHVYGRSNPMTGQIVAIDVVAREGADTDEIEDQIVEACAALPAASQPRRIRFVDDLDVRDTKIARRRAEDATR